MSEVGFYHLTRSSLRQALPPLLARTLMAGQRALVLCCDDAQIAELDGALWECGEAWLPHGTAADGDAELQPIWLSTDDTAPNGAKFLFLVNPRTGTQLERFDRVFDLFDGNDPDAVAAARERWRSTNQSGHRLTYWQQAARGWEKKTG